MEQFARAGVGSDRVIVTNASGVSSGSMAEWTVGRLLQVWKGFRADDENQRKHEFRRTHGRTFAGSTIGIVGLGNIGVAVAQRVRALGCRVLGSKRSATPGAHVPGDRLGDGHVTRASILEFWIPHCHGDNPCLLTG